MHSPHRESVPRTALLAMAAIVAFSVLAAGVTRLTGNYTVAPPPAQAVESRELQFADRPDGGITVTDARDGSVVETLAPGTHGFVRGILRSMARTRKVNGVGSEPAFTLTRWSDGRHSIEDPTTGTTLHLAAFGFGNVAEFASMLSGSPQPHQGRSTLATREVKE